LRGQSSFRMVDLHADLPLDIVRRRRNGERQVLETRHLQKLRKGSVSTLVAPIWVESNYKPTQALKRGLEIVNAFLEDVDESPHFQLIRKHEDISKADRDEKIGLILGVEGGELIEDDLDILRLYYRLGVRCFGLMWNQRNLMADGYDHVQDDQGLTRFGQQVIEELEKLRIIVDLAHMAPRSFWDAMKITNRPLIVSHATTIRHRGLRNMTDEQLKAIARNRGVVGILAVNLVIDGTETIPDLQTYCDHIEYAVKIAGPEHVGLGPDFYDYYVDDLRTLTPNQHHKFVRGLEDHSKLTAVITELSRRGLSDDEIRLICHDNFVRVFREVVG
jgi:membrane dipeptidase